MMTLAVVLYQAAPEVSCTCMQSQGIAIPSSLPVEGEAAVLLHTLQEAAKQRAVAEAVLKAAEAPNGGRANIWKILECSPASSPGVQAAVSRWGAPQHTTGTASFTTDQHGGDSKPAQELLRERTSTAAAGSTSGCVGGNSTSTSSGGVNNLVGTGRSGHAGCGSDPEALRRASHDTQPDESDQDHRPAAQSKWVSSVGVKLYTAPLFILLLCCSLFWRSWERGRGRRE